METKTFGWIINQKITENQINNSNVSSTVLVPVIHRFSQNQLDLKLLGEKGNKNNINSNTVTKYINQYYGYVKMYTD